LLERHISNDGELGVMAIAMDGTAMINNQFAMLANAILLTASNDGDPTCSQLQRFAIIVISNDGIRELAFRRGNEAVRHQQ
jgi:hypothetical protein